MNLICKLNRRDFLKAAGITSTGFALQATLTNTAMGADLSMPFKGSTHRGLSLNVFIHIAENDRVTIVAHRSEMGQGIRTSLPQVVADELDADWEKIDIVQAEGDKKYGDQNTDGSYSVRSCYQTMRRMGASAKLMLRQAAAEQWKVPLDECVAKNHQVIHNATGKILRYGELAIAAAKLPLPDVKLLSFKSEHDFKYIGKPMAMRDIQDMVQGSANYGIDTQLPGMVYASIERCPILGGKVKSFDASKSLQVSGVLKAIKIDGGIEPAEFNPLAGVAIIATNTWAAMQGRKQLQIEWEHSSHAAYDSRELITQLLNKKDVDAKVVGSKGDIDTAFAQAVSTYEAAYSLPHLEHATMEPPAATAVFSGDRCEIWACTQNPMGARELVAKLLGFKIDNVKVNVTLLGGGFGRKSKSDFIVEAALLAKAVGKPVKVTWSREDAIRNGYYHAYSVQHFKAALDKNNNIIGMDSTVASPSIMSLFKPKVEYLAPFELSQGFTVTPYTIPNIRARNIASPAHTRIGWVRSVYNINHAFALNSFIDELAHLGKRDPLEYQLSAIGPDRVDKIVEDGIPDDEQQYFWFKTARLKNVLQEVKKSSGWPAKVNKDEGWGIATHRSFLSYVAVATKVSLASGSLRVLEVHIAIDCGQILNPDRVQSQMEGSVIFGLSGALFGEISFKDGAVEQSSFDNYPLLRMHQSPKIVVTLVHSTERHTGVGEPGVPPIGASLTNAIVAAGGPRIRDLPVRRHLNVV